MNKRRAIGRRATGAVMVVTTALATAGCGGDTELPGCGDDEVAAQLIELLDDQMCLAMPMNVHLFVRDLKIEEPKVKLSAARTLEISERPARNRCQAKISFAARLSIELLGLMPGRTLTLQAEMDDTRYNYIVQREDDGTLYVGIDSKDPTCFALDRLTKLDGEAKDGDED